MVGAVQAGQVPLALLFLLRCRPPPPHLGEDLYVSVLVGHDCEGYRQALSVTPLTSASRGAGASGICAVLAARLRGLTLGASRGGYRARSSFGYRLSGWPGGVRHGTGPGRAGGRTRRLVRFPG